MKPIRLTMALSAADADGICETQTPAAGGVQSLTIDGILASGGVVTLPTPQHVSITTADDESARSFTVSGTDRYGNAITETIAGPNATTALGAKNFKTVTGIAVDDDTAGAVTAGVTDVGESKWFPLNLWAESFLVAVACDVTGTVNYTIQHTHDDVFAAGFQESDATAFSHATIAGKAADFEGTYIAPVTAVRLKVNSGTGTVATTITQAGPSC